MAYDPNKDKNPNENPYESVVGGAIGAQTLKGGGASQAPGMFSTTKPSGEALPGAGGASAGGHVNFDQIYNANAGTSAREAKKMQGAAQNRGELARTGIAGAQEQFNQAARTGAYSPTQQQADWANWLKSGPTGVKQPKAVVAASSGDAVTGQQRSQTERGEGLDAGGYWGDDGKWVSTVDVKDDAGNVTIPAAVSAPPEDALAQLKAGAEQKYTGPGSLSELDMYEQLLADTEAASDEARSLGMGNEGIQGRGLNALDAALVGTSGRKGFEQLSQRYGGLDAELDAANTASVGVANTARKQADDAASAYQALLDETGGYEDRVAADKAKADATNKRSDKIAAGTSPLLGSRNKESFLGVNGTTPVGYPAGLDSPGEFSQLYNDFGLTSSKGDGQFDNPDDGELFAALGITEADAAALAEMSAEERKAWFEARKKEKGL